MTADFWVSIAILALVGLAWLGLFIWAAIRDGKNGDG